MQGLSYISSLIFALGLSFVPREAYSYSANRVWIEQLDSGLFRVRVIYTVPALKEFREAHAIYKSEKEANAFYQHLLRGGDFATGGEAKMWFIPPKKGPNPW